MAAGSRVPSLHRGHHILICIFKKPTYLTDFLHTPGVSGTFWRLISKLGVSSCTINWCFTISAHLRKPYPCAVTAYTEYSFMTKPQLMETSEASSEMKILIWKLKEVVLSVKNLKCILTDASRIFFFQLTSRLGSITLMQWIKNATLPFQLAVALKVLSSLRDCDH